MLLALILLDPSELLCSSWKLPFLSPLPGILFCQFSAWLRFYHPSGFCSDMSFSEKRPSALQSPASHLSTCSLNAFHRAQADFLAYLLIFFSHLQRDLQCLDHRWLPAPSAVPGAQQEGVELIETHCSNGQRSHLMVKQNSCLSHKFENEKMQKKPWQGHFTVY